MSCAITGYRISLESGLLCLPSSARAINNQHDRDITLVGKRGSILGQGGEKGLDNPIHLSMQVMFSRTRGEM